MIVAVIPVGVMEMAVHQMIHVIAVRQRLVAAARTVGVVLTVGLAGVSRRAVGRIRAAYRELVLVHVACMGMVEVAVVEVVGVPFVAHRDVAAAFAVDVIVAAVLLAGHV